MEPKISPIDQRLKSSFSFSQQLADVTQEFLLGQLESPSCPPTSEFVGHEFSADGVASQVLHALLTAEPKTQLEYAASSTALFPTHEPLPAQRDQLVGVESYFIKDVTSDYRFAVRIRLNPSLR